MPSALWRIVVCLAAFSWPSYVPSEVDVGHSSVNGTAVDTTRVHDDRPTVEDSALTIRSTVEYISLPTPCVGDTCTIRGTIRGRFTCPPPRDIFLAASIYIYHLRRRKPRLLSQSAVFLLSVLFDTTPGKGMYRIILYAIFICKVTVLAPFIFVKWVMSIVFVVVLPCLYFIQYIILGVVFLIAMVPYTCWMHLIRGVNHCHDQIVHLSMYVARPFQSRCKLMALISLMSTCVLCMVAHVRGDFEWQVIIAAVVSRLAWSMYCQNTPRVIFEAVYTLLSPAALISFYLFICSSHAFEFEAIPYLIFLTAAFDRRLHFNGNLRCILASVFAILPVLSHIPWYLAIVTATLVAIWPSLTGQSASSSSKNVVEDKKSGEYRLSHHLDLKTGMYRGRQILDPKE